MYRYIIRALFFCMMLISINVQAQFSTEAAKKELERRGLTEQEVKEALLLKGIDVNNIDTSNPAALQKHEQTIRETLDELERNKKQGQKSNSTATPVSNKQSTNEDVKAAIKDEDVKDAIKEGATVDEAIEEELQEKQSEITPPAIIYGHQLYRNKTIKLFRTTDGAKVPPTYKLGPGDVVSISIWGDTEFNLNQEINKEGFIKPDRIPRIFLSGYTITEAKAAIFKKLRKYMLFTQSQMALSLITARTINVNIVGDVFNPGSYNISAINSAINAMVAAGGPNNLGSVRNIKLLSPGKGEKTIDLYKYLFNPLVSEDYYLSENDYIFVPIAKKVIQVSGAINRPFKYELLDNENLISLIEYAGGLKTNAVTKNIQITRIFDDEETIIDVDYTKAKSGDFALKNGDKVSIRTISSEADNFISIDGAVENPGVYQFREGLKIKEILEKAILKDNAITDLVYIRRLNGDLKSRRYEIVNIDEAIKNSNSSSNLELERGDIIKIGSASDYVDNFSVEISGAVRNPRVIQLDIEDNIKISDLIYLAGGVTNDVADFGYVYRKDEENDNKIEYIYFKLEEVLFRPDGPENMVIRPEDRVKVFNKSTFIDESSVEISGAVRNPGEILFDDNLSLRDALLMSGGLKREASNSRIEVYRIEIGDEKKTKTLVATVNVEKDGNFEKAGSFKLQPFDQVIVRRAPEFELQQNVNISGEVTYPGKYALLTENTRISDLIRQAGNLSDEAFTGGATLNRTFDETGFVIIDLKKALNETGSKYDLIIRAGDQLNIPKRNTLVAISGATNAREYYPENLINGKVNVSFEGVKRANYYINKYAGGVADNGSKKSIVVEYPNGEVKRTKKVLFFNIYPKVKEGSHIKVANKKVETKEEKEKSDIDWGEVLANSITQATAILSLVLLLRSLD